MYFSHHFTIALVSLFTLTNAIPATTVGAESLANRYNMDHERHHPKRETSLRPSASISAVKRSVPTVYPINLPLGAPIDLARCPPTTMACPIVPMTDAEVRSAGPNVAYECPDEDLYSCGGCATLGSGTDCTAIPNVLSVSCSAGLCNVHSCQAGFVLSSNSQRCVPCNGVSDGPLSFQAR
nr:uncharacterized protein CI109_003682 [Kwoniella shandongensis]KAA5528027.1 hypothetical protein CI109_003682 [Kwoniella shandongensis]